MSFDQSTILEVVPKIEHGDRRISWTSSSPDGSIFQVYLDGVLAWTGTSRTCKVPKPGSGRSIQIDVGVVTPDARSRSFGRSLPRVSGTGRTVTLTWEGGTYLSPDDDDVAGFHVYRSTSAGGTVDYSTTYATVPAYIQGIVDDGFGEGGFGEGGFGRSATYYTWVDPAQLPNGVWSYGVKAFDAAGNESTVATYAATVTGPPSPPAANPAGVRLTYTYNATTRVATLSWLASPG